MNVEMDMDRYLALSRPQADMVTAWVEAQGIGMGRMVRADREGEAFIEHYVDPCVTVRWCDCEATLIRSRHRVKTTTPPPWLHAGWTDE